jgi:type IV pilus assembly protein PilE
MFKNSKGFTLVEIMIVIGIIALLAAIAIPNLLRVKINANDASAKATLKTISNALENFMSTNQNYPNDTTSLIGITPPYLAKDYFTGTYNGYTYSASLTNYDYVVTANPIASSSGTTTITLTTGGIISP